MDEDGVSVPHKIVNLNIGGVRYTTTSTVWILLLLVFISLPLLLDATTTWRQLFYWFIERKVQGPTG